MLKRAWRRGNPPTLLVGAKIEKLKIELPYDHDPGIPLPDTYLEKTIIQKNTGTLMFIAALFTTARTWKQPKCLSTEIYPYTTVKRFFKKFFLKKLEKKNRLKIKKAEEN